MAEPPAALKEKGGPGYFAAASAEIQPRQR